MSTPPTKSAMSVSVIVATYNRPAGIARLLADLAAQDLPSEAFDVCVVDDGSAEPAEAGLMGKPMPARCRIVRQTNGGAARARQAGADLARGDLLVFLDDDMRVDDTFLRAHVAAHKGSEGERVVLGHLRADAALESMPIFERFYAVMLDRMKDRAAGGTQPRGEDIYTGNLSVARALFERVGGFDLNFGLIEDAELGVRLAKAGAAFVFSAEAYAVHASDHTSEDRWLARSAKDGQYWTRLARKHADTPSANPWRFMSQVNPISRPLLWLSVVAPEASTPLAKTVMKAVHAADAQGLNRAAIAGTTLAYGIQYFQGVRKQNGSFSNALAEYNEFRVAAAKLSEPESQASLLAALRTDHAALVATQTKYGGGSSAPDRTLWSDMAQNIGFQTLCAYRVMRAFYTGGFPLAAKFCARLIRHLYGSDIHWEAHFEPGVVLVHGFGLAIAPGVRVDAGATIFQHVTLGHGRSPDGRNGTPHIHAGASVGVGVTIAGPIHVGERSKIMAGCTVREDVPRHSVLEAPAPVARARG